MAGDSAAEVFGAAGEGGAPVRGYIRKERGLLDRDYQGKVMPGSVVGWAYFVELYDDAGGELLDDAGPFDDEHDAEMMRRRALEQAA